MALSRIATWFPGLLLPLLVACGGEDEKGTTPLVVSANETVIVFTTQVGTALVCGQANGSSFRIELGARRVVHQEWVWSCPAGTGVGSPKRRHVANVLGVKELTDAQRDAFFAAANNVEIYEIDCGMYDGTSLGITVERSSGQKESYNNGVNGACPTSTAASGQEVLYQEAAKLFE